MLNKAAFIWSQNKKQTQTQNKQQKQNKQQ